MAGKSVFASRLASMYRLPLISARDLLASAGSLSPEDAKVCVCFGGGGGGSAAGGDQIAEGGRCERSQLTSRELQVARTQQCSTIGRPELQVHVPALYTPVSHHQQGATHFYRLLLAVM
jgi:hypothetical protein